MNAAQLHRGPDQGGEHHEPGVALGHRRLSIIDLSGGRQPLTNEDGSVVLIYNGEIYNFEGLAKELQAAGHTFRTHCDTEVVVHAWEEWGAACVERFNGMFAFALWDRNRQTLFLARDRLGKKPLYYAFLDDGCVAFASELKALLVHPRLRRELDRTAIEDYFAFGYVPDPKTIFTGVRKLPPAHTLELRRGASPATPKQYWDVAFAARQGQDSPELRDELIERLREATRIRLISEVPLGAFLSGGVDSSAVVSMMAGLLSEPVNTCSMSFGDRRYDESNYAAEMARRYRTNHYVEQVDADDFDLIDRLAAIYDEPFADSSAIPTYRVCGLARKRVTVALSGDGGDETFAGYRRYRWHMYEERIRRALPAPIRRPVLGALGRWYPKLDWAPKFLRAKTTFEASARDSLEGYLHSVSVTTAGLREQLFSAPFKSSLQGYNALEVFREHGRNAPDDPLSLVQYLDFKTYLPGDILVKVDRASMAHSLEVRVPLLDYTLVQWAAELAPQLKLRGREGKYIFKKSLEPHVPADTLYRPKMGFAVPIASWFRGPLKQRVRDAVLGSRLADTGTFEPATLTRLVDEHQSGFGEHSAVLWSLLMFDAFLKRIA
jgi:asparagine synthase (glutamine-hydrolysing)